MRRKKSKKLIISLVSLVLIIGILCGAFLPRLLQRDVTRYNLVNAEHTAVGFDKGFEPFVLAGGSVLYVNRNSGAVVIADDEGEVVFNSHSESAAESKTACVLSLTLRDKTGNAYVMDSSINSAAKGSFKISTEKKNDVTITFNFPDEGAESEPQSIPVKFYEENGGIVASVDLSQATLNNGFVIEKISILPGLFSENKPSGKCFYTIPDGCGAEIDLNAVAKEAYSQTLDVYGSDITFSEYSQGATLPCFSMTKNKAMLTAVIKEGDALSSLYVKHNKNKGGNLYNTFTVTPYGKINGKLVKGDSYSGVVSQVYYLTTSGNRNYNTVSSIVRDCLTEKGYLPSENNEAFVDYPFFITAIGSENGKKNDIYTSFENASEMIALLKSRGVRSIALRFSGAGKNGLKSGARNSTAISTVLGGKKAYNKLCKIAKEKNSSVWYDVDFALTPFENGKNADSYKQFREYLAKDSVKSNTATYNGVYSNISKTYKNISELESGNVCINDLSYFLYTDVRGAVNRQEALLDLKGKVESLSVNGHVMLSNPAVYLLGQADAVFSVPQKACLEEFSGVTSVPLLQMVLHGNITYGSEPINLFENSQDALLKAVEYGAAPSFVFTHDKCAVLDYGVYATQTAKFYSSAKRMLPLMDMKITSHQQVVSGVYKIIYDYSKVVYVNYNPSVVEVNGILVSAKDFVVI